MAANKYAIRKEILQAMKRYHPAPMNALDLIQYGLPPFITREEALEQWNELKLMGYLEAKSGFGGEYCLLSEKGKQQLSPEFSQDEFIYGPGAIH